MKRGMIAVLILVIAGCGSPKPKAKPKDTIDEERLARAREAYEVFFDEALKGAQLLEAAASAADLDAQARKAREALDKAADVYPSLPRLREMADEGKGTLRFFTKSLEMLRRRDKQTEVSEKTRAGVADACRKNADAVRKMVERMKTKF